MPGCPPSCCGAGSTQGKSLKTQANSKRLTHVQPRLLLLDLSKLRNFTSYRYLTCILHDALDLLFLKEVCDMSWKGVIGIRIMLRCLCFMHRSVPEVSFMVLTRRKTLCKAPYFKRLALNIIIKILAQKRLSSSSLSHGLRFTICKTFQRQFCCV